MSYMRTVLCLGPPMRTKRHVKHGDFFLYETHEETYFCLVAESYVDDQTATKSTEILWLGSTGIEEEESDVDYERLRCPFVNDSDIDFINNIIDNGDGLMSPQVTILDIDADSFFKDIINELTK